MAMKNGRCRVHGQRLRRAEDARGQGTGAAVELEALPALGSVHRHEAGYCTGGPGSRETMRIGELERRDAGR